MSRITKIASINATPDVVIDYIANVNNHPAFISALKSVDNLQGSPKNIGESWNWTFVMGGIEVQGNAETTSFVDAKNYSFSTTSGIPSTFSYSAEPENDGTRLTLDVKYDLPSGILAKMTDAAVIERLNEQESDQAISNLQVILGD